MENKLVVQPHVITGSQKNVYLPVEQSSYDFLYGKEGQKLVRELTAIPNAAVKHISKQDEAQILALKAQNQALENYGKELDNPKCPSSVKIKLRDSTEKASERAYDIYMSSKHKAKGLIHVLVPIATLILGYVIGCKASVSEV